MKTVEIVDKILLNLQTKNRKINPKYKTDDKNLSTDIEKLRKII